MKQRRQPRGGHAALAFAILAVGFWTSVSARPGFGDPASGLRPLREVDVWIAPGLNSGQLLERDRQATADQPLRVAQPIPTDLDPSNSGTWEALPQGGKIWRLKLHSATALWLALGFDRLRLQPGASLEVYDPSGRNRIGPFTSADQPTRGRLSVPPIAGDSAVIELFWPEALAEMTPAIHLGRVSHGYRELVPTASGRNTLETLPESPAPTTLGDDAASCNVDINCPLGDDWQDEKRGIVLLLTGQGALCSGSMILTTTLGCRPLLLTANHCLSTAQDAEDSIVFFNKERAVCNQGTASTSEWISGTTLKATWFGSDFTLLELSQSPPPTFNVFYNGWNRGGAPATESWMIHHPVGSGKKISHDADVAVDSPVFRYWRVTEWEEGVAEVGSSGAPLFDTGSRIVGQLFGGLSSCTAALWDDFGKLSESWGGAGSPSTRLSDWLDPLGLGLTTLDGINHDQCVEGACGSDEECDDGNGCTADTCDLGTVQCVFTPIVDGDNDGFCAGLGAGPPLDCDDADDQVFPGASEVCDGVNNDCDDPTWPALPAQESDADTDGYAVCQGDCNDGNAAIHPEAMEVCNGADDDCDVEVDEDSFGQLPDGSRWFHTCRRNQDQGRAPVVQRVRSAPSRPRPSP